MSKYTYCRIQFIDDGNEMDVIIKADDEIDPRDDEIFFYGISEDELRYFCDHETIVEGEWTVVDVYESYDSIP